MYLIYILSFLLFSLVSFIFYLSIYLPILFILLSLHIFMPSISQLSHPSLTILFILLSIHIFMPSLTPDVGCCLAAHFTIPSDSHPTTLTPPLPSAGSVPVVTQVPSLPEGIQHVRSVRVCVHPHPPAANAGHLCVCGVP